MSTPDPVAPEVGTGQRALREWLDRRSSHGHPIRDEFARVCLSAVLRRLAFFGVEDGLQRYPARELLVFQTMCSGGFAAMLARIATGRAVVEDDRGCIEAIGASGMADAMLGWFTTIARTGASEVQEVLAGISDREEELSVARLVVARVHPSLIQAGWLWEVPDCLPMVGYELCKAIIHTRPDLLPTIAPWLVRHREALLADEPDAILAPLVAASAERPTTTLSQFEGIYGEPTIVAAAEWHLEHGEPQPAIELAARIRALSLLWDRARQVESAARLELGDLDGARAAARAIDDPLIADAADLRIATTDPLHLGPAELEALLERCPRERPETFFAGLRLLLQRGGLAQARTLCARRRQEFADHAPLSEAIALVTRASG